MPTTYPIKRMPTYREIQDFYKSLASDKPYKNLETCWIADVKRRKFPDYYKGPASNRHNPAKVHNPCPPIVEPYIIDAITTLGNR